jgi:DNA-binding PadR family transcriptional regulator
LHTLFLVHTADLQIPYEAEMGAGIAKDSGALAMRSAVGWGVLGLLIERTGYGYDVFHRFGRAYGDAIELSSPSQIYKALTALEERGLIERLPREEPVEDPTRQPKPHYRATSEGLCCYQHWLITQVTHERQRSSLFPVQLAMLEPHTALAVLERYEQSLLAERKAARGVPHVEGTSLARRLVDEVRRLEAGQALEWIAYARRELEAAIAAQGPER